MLAGSLGSQVLSRFVVTFDYPHRRVFFAPNPDASKPYDTRTFGLSVEQVNNAPGKPVVVVDIAPGSPAAAAGVTLYDQILSIDGQPTRELGLTEVRRRLSPAAGTVAHAGTAVNCACAAHGDSRAVRPPVLIRAQCSGIRN